MRVSRLLGGLNRRHSRPRARRRRPREALVTRVLESQEANQGMLWCSVSISHVKHTPWEQIEDEDDDDEYEDDSSPPLNWLDKKKVPWKLDITIPPQDETRHSWLLPANRGQ